MSSQPSLTRMSPTSSTGRVLCGWCDRLVALEPTGVTRHVTCEDCRELAARLNHREVAVVPTSAGASRKP